MRLSLRDLDVQCTLKALIGWNIPFILVMHKPLRFFYSPHNVTVGEKAGSEQNPVSQRQGCNFPA